MEAEVIARSPGPASAATLAADLRAAGGAVLVHTAMSRLGWVVGGAQWVVGALTYRAAGGPVAAARVGLADTLLLPVRPLVDFGAQWLPSHRS